MKLAAILIVASLGVWQFVEHNTYFPAGALGAGTQGLAYSRVEKALYSSDTVVYPNARSWDIRKSSDDGRTWRVVHSHPLLHTQWAAHGRGFAFNSKGTVFAIGRTEDSQKSSHWLVLRGRNQGSQWKVVDDFVFFPAPGDHYAYHVAVSRSDEICVTGRVRNNTIFARVTQTAWTVRCSVDEGETWRTIDSELGAESAGIAFDSKGNLFVAGSIDRLANGVRSRDLRVKRLMKGGRVWEEVDVFPVAGGASGAISTFVDSRDWIYVAGSGLEATPDKSQLRRWILRRSQDGGTTWKTLDRFFLNPATFSEAYEVAEDHRGRIFVVGYAMDSDRRFHAIVRMSEDSGETWTTAVDETGKDNAGIYGHNIAATSSGRIFISGNWNTPGGGRSLIGEVMQRERPRERAESLVWHQRR